jgi:hypothetical protein
MGDRYEVLEEYVHSQRAEIDQGKPIVLEVRNTDTFERLVVRAQVAPPGHSLDGGTPLALMNLAENVSSDQWQIRVLEELDPEAVEIRPVSDFRRNAPDGS